MHLGVLHFLNVIKLLVFIGGVVLHEPTKILGKMTRSGSSRSWWLRGGGNPQWDALYLLASY